MLLVFVIKRECDHRLYCRFVNFETLKRNIYNGALNLSMFFYM